MNKNTISKIDEFLDKANQLMQLDLSKKEVKNLRKMVGDLADKLEKRLNNVENYEVM